MTHSRYASPVARLLAACALVCALAVVPAAAQDAYVNDGTLDSGGEAPAECNAEPDYNTIQDAVNSETPGSTIYVCPGTYAENVIVDNSVTLQGNNAGTPGGDARSMETTVVSASSSPATGVLFDVQVSDVTVDGFFFEGDSPGVGGAYDAVQGVLIDAEANAGVGDVTVRNSIFDGFPNGSQGATAADVFPGGIVGRGASSGNVFADNFAQNFEAFDVPAGGDEDKNAGIAVFNEFLATLTDNSSNSVAYGLFMAGNGTMPTVSGGTHTDDYRGINIFPGAIDSEYTVEDVAVEGSSDFGIISWRFNASGRNPSFGDGNSDLTLTINNATVTGTGNVEGDAAGIATNLFSGGGTYVTNINESTISDNENRGLNAYGSNDPGALTMNVDESLIEGNGYNPNGAGNAFGAVAQRGAVMNIENSVLNNESATNSAPNATAVSASSGGNVDNDNGVVTVFNSQILAGDDPGSSPVGTAAATENGGVGSGTGDPGQLDASGNWWGTTDASTFAVVENAEVLDVTPYLVTGIDTENVNPDDGFFGDFSGLGATPLYSQTGAEGRLEESVTLVDNSAFGTVDAEAGTFAENLVLAKNNVELSGANVGTAGTGSRGPETTVVPATQNQTDGAIIDVQANTVAIDGFFFDADNAELNGSSGADAYDAVQGVRIDAEANPGISDVAVANNIFDGFPNGSQGATVIPAGVAGTGASSENIFEGNLAQNFQGFQGGETNAGFFVADEFQATLTANSSSDVIYGILMSGNGVMPTVSGGTHDSNYYGIGVFPGTVDSEYTVDNTTVTNSTQFGIISFRFGGGGAPFGDGSQNVDLTITNTSVTGTTSNASNAAGISTETYGGTGIYTTNIEDSDVSQNGNRGINARGNDGASGGTPDPLTINVLRTTVIGNGFDEVGDTNAFGINASRGAEVNVENSVVDNGNAPSTTPDVAAVATTAGSGAPGQDNGFLTITNSQILANGGIAAFAGSVSGGGSPGLLDASGNWWGGTDASAFAVIENTDVVDVTPFLNTSTDVGDGDATNGFEGNFSRLTATSAYSQTGSIGRLAEANALLDPTSGSPAGRSRLAIDADAEGSEPDPLAVTDDVTLAPATILDLTTGTLDVAGGGGSLMLASEAAGTAYISGRGSGSISGDVTIERFVQKSNNAAHYRFLSSPLAVMLDDAGSPGNSANLLSNVRTQSTGSGANGQVAPENSTVYVFDETADAPNNAFSDLVAQWSPVADLNQTITPGEGYLVYLFQNNRGAGPDGFPVTLSTTGAVSAAENNGTDQSPTLTFTNNDPDSGENPAADDLDGWNFIANPFAAPLDWEDIVDTTTPSVDATVYVYDGRSEQYISYTAGDADNASRYLAPYQSFFVKANGSGPDLTLSSAEKATLQAPEFQSEAAMPRVALELQSEDGSRNETTGFRFTEDAQAGKDRFDAYQLYPLTGSYALVASQMEGTDALFDHQNLPLPVEEPMTIDLSIDATVAGDYTLSAASVEALPGDWQVTLEDLSTGQTYDLLAGEAAPFTQDETAQSNAEGAERLAPTVASAAASEAGFRLHVGPDARIPVELASFEAVAEGSDAVLTWRTLTEDGNRGFEVQQRVTPEDGTTAEGGEAIWETVGFREGAGTTTEAQDYRFTVRDLPLGAYTFRLRQEDFDGDKTPSGEASVEVGLAESYVVRSVYPNPVRTDGTLEFAVREAEHITVTLYNVLGQRVQTLYDGEASANEFETVTVHTGSLASGLYLLRIEGERFTETQSFSVVR